MIELLNCCLEIFLTFLADRVGSWVTVIIGVIFVVCVVAFRRGFVGELLAWQQRRRSLDRRT